MSKMPLRRVAEEAARLMAAGAENEYIHAKTRALEMLGISGQTRLPSNRKIKDCIARLTQEEIGADEVHRRLRAMRQIAYELITVLEIFDPFLIGSTLTGEIRRSSDIDLHVYSDDYAEVEEHLAIYGYDEIDIEQVENRKGSFVHLRWLEQGFPIEITIYPWSWRTVTLYSSVTGKPMKRADIHGVKKLLNRMDLQKQKEQSGSSSLLPSLPPPPAPEHGQSAT
jgi:predicted nucleotidyltransferase